MTLILALFSHLALAGEWKHLTYRVDGYQIRLSYTTAVSPATYGSAGGAHDGLFYVDVYSPRAARAQEVEIREASGERGIVTRFPLQEESSTHAFGQKPLARTYAERLWVGKPFRFIVTVDGRTIEGLFTL